MAFDIHITGADDSRLKEIAADIYPPALLPLQQSGDRVNPDFFRHYYLLTENGRACGKLAVYENPAITTGKKKTVILGNYECVANDEAANFLLSKVIADHPGCTLLGPMNGSTWDNYRFCTSPPEELFFSEMVGMPYYPKQWKDNGFSVAATYVSTIQRNMTVTNPQTVLRYEELKKNGIRFRPIDLDNFEKELENIFLLCTLAFSRNLMYSPISFEQFSEKYLAVKKYIRPEFVFMADNSEGKLVAFFFNFHDYLCTKEKRLIVKSIARDPDPAYKGIGDVMGYLTTKLGAELGYDAIIHALMYSGNYSLTLSGKFDSAPFRNYELYTYET